MDRKKIGKRGAAVTGVAAVAVLAMLFGTGKLGFGTGVGLGETGAPNDKEEQAVVATVDAAAESTQPKAEAPVAEERIEIRIQGREYNYQNVSYGTGEHPLEELLQALDQFPRDARIELSVEADATKNAVDELEKALAEAGFTNVRK